MAQRKFVSLFFWGGGGGGGKKTQRTLNVSAIAETLKEVDLPWKLYSSLCINMVSYSTDTASYGNDAVSYCTNTVSCSSSGKKRLPALCSVWPPASSLVYFAVMQPGLFSGYCLIHCTTTRSKTPFSELRHALCYSAIVFSVTRAVIRMLSNILWCH